MRRTGASRGYDAPLPVRGAKESARAQEEFSRILLQRFEMRPKPDLRD